MLLWYILYEVIQKSCTRTLSNYHTFYIQNINIFCIINTVIVRGSYRTPLMPPNPVCSLISRTCINDIMQYLWEL